MIGVLIRLGRSLKEPASTKTFWLLVERLVNDCVVSIHYNLSLGYLERKRLSLSFLQMWTVTRSCHSVLETLKKVKTSIIKSLLLKQVVKEEFDCWNSLKNINRKNLMNSKKLKNIPLNLLKNLNKVKSFEQTTHTEPE